MAINSKNKDAQKPHYSGMILDYVEFHGTEFVNPKGWYRELVHGSEKHKPTRVSTPIKNTSFEQTPEGMIVTTICPMSKKMIDESLKAKQFGGEFKIYARKDKRVRILYDNNARQSVAAYNRQVGFEHYKIENCVGELISFDIQNGQLIIKLIIKG